MTNQRQTHLGKPPTWLWMVGLWALGSLGACRSGPAPPAASQGLVDLSGWDLAQSGPVSLNGEWDFYWQAYLQGPALDQAEPLRMRVPASWTTYQLPSGQAPPAEGHATYRLRVRLPPAASTGGPLAFKVVSVATSYALWADGQRLSPPRALGRVPQTTEVQYDPAVYVFVPTRDTLELVLHVANHEFNVAGLIRHLRLGTVADIKGEYDRTLVISFSFIGVLVIMGFSYLALYFFWPGHRSVIYFVLYCFLVALRALLTDDYYFSDLFPRAPFELGNKLSYLSFAVGEALLVLFVRSLYPQDFARWAVVAILAASAAYGGLVLATDSLVYSSLVIYYQGFSLLAIGYGFYFLGRILYLRRPDSLRFTFGILAILLASVNDILVANLQVASIHLVPLGGLVFVATQALILARRFAHTYERIEQLTTSLAQHNQHLEGLVQQRSGELTQINGRLADNLLDLSANMATIASQHQAIKAQHQGITDSLHYARLLQSTMLPDWGQVRQLFPDSFLLFWPKAIVSGDFYYFNQRAGLVFLAAADCTGHGVPSALLSVLGTRLLDELIDVHHLTEPAQILSGLHKGLYRLLKPETSQLRDGMDLALVVLDPAKRELKFAGAKSPLVYVRGGELGVVAGDRLHLGGSALTDDLTFGQTTLALPPEPGHFSFYLFSDGYQGQLSNGQERKLMKKQFHELLFQFQAHPMPEQAHLLAQWHHQWRTTLPQTDDVLVMGFRV
jgi:serine phosphatase RsbU (regulator of sigma subunit)